MSNPAKQKGTSFETLCVNFLKAKGFLNVFRPALTGKGDTGDINGIEVLTQPHCGPANVGKKAIIQCKNQRTLKLPEWMRATKEQAARVAPDTLGILVVKRNGAGAKAVGQNYAIMELEDLATLLLEAGYGSS
jgi:hypothetical protein